MKKLFFIAAFAAASFAGKAQDESIMGLKFGLGANLGIPIGDLADISSIGAGIDLLGQYGISEQIAITADVGYTSMFGKKVNTIDFPDISIIPIRAGLRFFPSPQFFLGAKAGVGILKSKNSDSYSATAYSFGAGYYVNPSFDVSASYDGYSKNGSLNLINIRLGYTFGH